jgi:hypothetical protein
MSDLKDPSKRAFANHLYDFKVPKAGFVYFILIEEPFVHILIRIPPGLGGLLMRRLLLDALMDYCVDTVFS